MYNHQETYHNVQLSVLRDLYAELEAKYRAALYAQSEGVFQVTIRSLSQTITIAVDGMDASQLVIEELSNQLSKAESDLRWHLAEQGSEYADELQKSRQKKQEAEADKKQRWAEYEAQQQQLARMAATSSVPPQKGPGRPKKAQPQPEVMQAVGALAAQVPMNHGSTGQAVARAANIPVG